MVQYVNKQLPSTETALLVGHSDVTLNMDKGKVTLPILYLSVAFDSCDHISLVYRISLWYDIYVELVNVISKRYTQKSYNWG